MASWLEEILSSIADRGRRLTRMPSPNTPPIERARRLAKSLIGGRGEATGTALARELVELYERLPAEDRLAFFEMLAADFGPDQEKLRAAAAAYVENADAETLRALSHAVEAPRQELLRRMNMAPGGTHALVRTRETLLAVLPDHPELAPVEADLKHLLTSWFNRGFLELQRIDWRTPAVILEKLIEYEAVHEIQGWDDLRRRLAPDRRCFAFFHPALRDEPLIFVEIALVKGLAGSIQALLEPAPPTHEGAVDAAIFYSISNCQPGLRGVSFGNFLIKQVVEELKAENAALSTFSTLSPIPSFRKRLERQRAGELPEEVRAALAILDEPGWAEDPERAAALRPVLERLCAEYLLTPSGRRSDPVARFHLGNGARIERINFLGDVSPKGMRESYGMMVNYLYDLATIEENHEAFVSGGRVVHSPAVGRMLNNGNGKRLPRLLSRGGDRG